MYRSLIAALFVSSLHAVYLPVPHSLSDRAVYYVSTIQIEPFSCGYNALFNALNFQHHCGNSSSFSAYSEFKKACQEYAKKHGLNTKKSTDSKNIKDLSGDILHISELHQLLHTDGAIRVYVKEGVSVRYPQGTTQRQVERLLEQAFEKQTEDRFEGIEARLKANMQRSYVVHFYSSILLPEGGHSIMLSLLQNETGRALYVFDNLNYPITERSEIKRVIDYICKRFMISKKHEFHPPVLPVKWDGLRK